MSLIDDLTARLVAGQRNGSRDVDQNGYGEPTRTEAYDVQRGTRVALGETVGVIKTAIQADGVGVAAPIYASHTISGGRPASLSLRRMVGVEVEIGVKLSRDVRNAADVLAAIDHYFLGIEVCGTRLRDRKLASANIGLADNMSAFGYVIGPRWVAGSAIDGLSVRLTLDGRDIYSAPAKHGFGTVLASLLAYADHQVDGLRLNAGTFVTTGSMCGLVPVTGGGLCLAKFGGESVGFTIVD